MVFPYRTLATIEPDLPPSPCRSPPLDPAWIKAVCAAGIFFLGTASAAMISLAAGATHPRPAARAMAPAAHLEAAPMPPRPALHAAPGEVASIRHATLEEEAPRWTGPSLALSALGHPTHAPEELWSRAGKLVAAGVDIVLTETRIADRDLVEDVERELSPSARILPAGGGQGIQISSLPAGSIARSAGLQRGDVITAVNGHALSTPSAVIAAYASVRQTSEAVLEVHRGGRPVVLKVGLARSATGLRPADRAPPVF
jgi:hypothetical protein